ncbi:hypothetical protein GCM10009756_17820 [Pseudokineococcus marinus]
MRHPEGPPGLAAAEDGQHGRDAVDRAPAEDLQAHEAEDVERPERDDDRVDAAVGHEHAVDEPEEAADGDGQQEHRHEGQAGRRHGRGGDRRAHEDDRAHGHVDAARDDDDGDADPDEGDGRRGHEQRHD